MPGITHWQSPRYFAYFAVDGRRARDPGRAADRRPQPGRHPLARLAGAAGARGGDARLAAAAARAARAVARAHRGRGVVRASITALAAARAAAPGRRVVVCSEHTHSSTLKAARLLELDVRQTPVDGAYALRPDALDLSGACAVVATVGTTSSTAVDPVAAIADRAAAEDVWLHVDAAYAGAAAVCPELRHHFAGWERADSIGMNPHKWLFVPMDCSAFFCRRPEALRDAFSLVPEYLRVSEEVVSLERVRLAARPALPGAEAVGDAPLLRPRGAAGDHPRAHPPGRALRASGWRTSRAGSSARRGRSRSCAFGGRGATTSTEALMERVNEQRRDLPLAHEARRPLRPSPRRSAMPARRRRTSRSPGTSSAARPRLSAATERDRPARRERLDQALDHGGVAVDLCCAGVSLDEQRVEVGRRAGHDRICVLDQARHDRAPVERGLLAGDVEADPRVRGVRGDGRPQRLLEPAGRRLEVVGRRAERAEPPAGERGEHGAERSAGLGELVDRRRGRGRQLAAARSRPRLELLQPGGEDVRAAAAGGAREGRCSGAARAAARARAGATSARRRGRAHGRRGSTGCRASRAAHFGRGALPEVSGCHYEVDTCEKQVEGATVVRSMPQASKGWKR